MDSQNPRKTITEQFNFLYNVFKSYDIPRIQDNIKEQTLKVNFYGAICDFINRRGDDLSDGFFIRLSKINGHLINNLWEFYRNNEYDSFNKDSEIILLFEDYATENHLDKADVNKELTFKEQLSQNAEANFYRFSDEQIKRPPQYIFNNAATIFFYKELYEYLTGTNELEEDVCEFLCTENDKVIDTLHNEFLIAGEDATINTWVSIYDFIQSYNDDYNPRCQRKSYQSKTEIEM